jgi:predicted ATPase
MGIPEGITLIVGGGFHGKSTLLQALQARRPALVAAGPAMRFLRWPPEEML